MATTQHLWSGTAKWCKHRVPDPEYGHYSVDLYLDNKSMKDYEKSGCQVQIKENEEGKYVQLRRPHEKLIKDEAVEFGPPKVAIKNAEGEWEAFDGLVGNGSKITARVVLYNTKRGIGHRLEGIGVEKLVPYEGGTQEDDYPF